MSSASSAALCLSLVSPPRVRFTPGSPWGFHHGEMLQFAHLGNLTGCLLTPSPLQWGPLLTQDCVTLLPGHWGLSHAPTPLQDTRLGMHTHSCWETSPGESSVTELTPKYPQLHFQPLHVRDQRVHPAHLAELLPVRVWDEGFQGLEASIDALHPPSLVAVGDFPAYPPLLVPLGLRSQWDVGQAARETRG